MQQSDTSSDDVERKLSAARSQLIIEKPFLGVLVLHLPLSAADPDWCKTTATDARSIYYNRAYIERLDLEQTKFVLAHEALHCGLSHFHRREHRIKRRWDIACDLAVNSILIADGLVPPPDALRRKALDGMSAEEIYPYVKDGSDEEPLDQHIYEDEEAPEAARGMGSRGGSSGGLPHPGADRSPAHAPGDADRQSPAGAPREQGAARPPPLRGPERDRVATQWQLRLAGAAQQALRAGKLPAGIARMIDDLLQPQLPWRMLLARYLSSVARTDYSFNRPSRRESAAILPGLRAASIDIAIVIDTSGSIAPDEMREFLSEVNALKGQVNARITLHACDAALTPEGPWVFEPWEEVRLPDDLAGGGGTVFAPAFEWAERLERRPDLLVYFTDADGEFPRSEPGFPVLWLVKGNAPVPWGQRVQLN